MKIKDFFGKIVENKRNKQFNTSFKKGELKKIGKTPEEFLNIKINPKLKKELFDY